MKNIFETPVLGQVPMTQKGDIQPKKTLGMLAQQIDSS